MPTTPLLFFILCIFTSVPLWAGESEDWVLAKEVDGITLYTRTADDAPVKAVKAVMVVAGTPGVAAALVMDAAATPEWIYGVESTEIIKSDGPDDVWVRNVIAMPWPLAPDGSRQRQSDEAGTADASRYGSGRDDQSVRGAAC